MNNTTIDNNGVALILESLKEFKADTNRRFDQIDKRFEQIDERFRQIDRRFDKIEEEAKEEKPKRRKNENKLDEVYKSRDQVTVGFSRSFAAINAFISGVIAMIVALFVGHLKMNG